jgi:hypothetical protein
MSLWLAGYPKTPGFDVRFGSLVDIDARAADVRFTPEKRTSVDCRVILGRRVLLPHSVELCLLLVTQ